jgi:hypothetical protein
LDLWFLLSVFMRGILCNMRRTVSALLVLLTLSCVGLVVYEQQVMETLYFGTQKPEGGVVSDAEWQSFLADEITSRFPSGLTTWEASGQWRDAHNAIERERTHIVQIVHPHSAEDEGRIAVIIEAYKKRFAQESVLRVRTDVWMPR